MSCGAGAARLRAPGPRGELGSLLGRGRGCGDGAVPAEGWPGHDSAFCWRSEALAGLSPPHPPPQGTRLGNAPGTGLGRTGPRRHSAPAGWSQPRVMAPAPCPNPPCCPWAGSGPAEGPQPRCQRWPSPAAQHPQWGHPGPGSPQGEEPHGNGVAGAHCLLAARGALPCALGMFFRESRREQQELVKASMPREKARAGS